ncbi:MAG: UbiX family flavin prenyltransferase [Desulfopila sp.]|nr:UbiX family flavin prenyltransferase [Desulfopila sp.]
MQKILLAVTGASGMLFLPPFIKLLAQHSDTHILHGICSQSGENVLQYEQNLRPQQLHGVSRWFGIDDFSAAPSSGSSGYDAMVILPCTMGTLGAIASGLSRNLIHRAADVMLKERKKLILAVRETPLGRTHLLNMLAVHDAGALIMPPMPGYYHRPTNLEEAALTYCWRLADQLGVKIKDRKRWEGPENV